MNSFFSIIRQVHKKLGNYREQDKGEWDKFQFLVLQVPTFWDYMTYMIQTLQGASWVTETEQAGGYVKF